jgi:hypothetical protein
MRRYCAWSASFPEAEKKENKKRGKGVSKPHAVLLREGLVTQRKTLFF